jgi:hypothetical protein
MLTDNDIEKLNFEEMDDNVLESEAKAMLQSTYCQRQYRWIKSSKLEN